MNVTHNRFGQGVITNAVVTQSNDNTTHEVAIRLTITFSDGARKILYCSKLRNCLQFENPLDQEELEDMIEEEQRRIDTENVRLLDGAGEPNPLNKNVENENFNELISRMEYGTSRSAIYRDCCDRLGWRWDGRIWFRGGLNDITPEHYDLWYLTYSNWNPQRNNRWTNEIYDGIKHIRVTGRVENDNGVGRKVIVFAKNGRGNYEFLGLYRQTAVDVNTVDINNGKEFYELIDDRYLTHN